MGECWHVPGTVGSLPPGLYCEDEATYAMLLADPAYETATVPAGSPSPMLHGLQVWIATPAQAAILRAMPAGTAPPAPEPGPDWKAIRDLGERFLLDFCQPDTPRDAPPLRMRKMGVPEVARRMMTSNLSPEQFAEIFTNPTTTTCLQVTQPSRARRRKDAARSRRG